LFELNLLTSASSRLRNVIGTPAPGINGQPKVVAQRPARMQISLSANRLQLLTEMFMENFAQETNH
jgi:hypothetical protein